MDSIVKRIAVIVIVLLPLAAVVVIAWWGERGDTLFMADAPPAWARLAPAQIAEARKHGVPVAFENDLGMRFVLIPAGTFLMGSPEKEVGRGNEREHEVTLTTPFYMQVTEVTNEQYRRFRPDHDSEKYRKTLNEDLQPVVKVTWAYAKDFAGWVSGRADSRTYRLPTEAEWEYACRAGTSERFSWGDDEADAPRFANTNDPKTFSTFTRLFSRRPDARAFPADDGHRVTAPVGSFLPNGWGLHDMHGNVMEFCGDFRAGYPTGPVADPSGPTGFPDFLGTGNPVLRGGAWSDGPEDTRSASRYSVSLDNRGGMRYGFRLVSPLVEPVKGDHPAWAAGEWAMNAEDARGVAVVYFKAMRALYADSAHGDIDTLEKKLSRALDGGSSEVVTLSLDGRASRRGPQRDDEVWAGTWTAVGDRVVVHWVRSRALNGEGGEVPEPSLFTRSGQELHQRVRDFSIRYERRPAASK